ncbi:MAG TPA: hypothetical protein VIF57_19745 [Polyangia bacterium]
MALALSAWMFSGACGSDGTSTGTQPLTCQDGQFRLQGTLGTETVDVTETSAGGGFDQLTTGEFHIGDVFDPSAPAPTQLHLTWAHGIADGASTPASGTLIPASGSFAGQTLCVGDGTIVSIYKNDNGIGLVLDGFASGASCETPVAGTLAGCWH